jgi:hypothetical protein
MAEKLTFETVRELGLALPDVEEGTAYGSPALKVRGKMFTCVPTHRTAEPGSLAIRLAVDTRDELIEADPRTYYITPHYVDYAVVLVRLSRLRRDVLQDLLRMSWEFVRPTGSRVTRRRRRAVE